MRFKGIPCNKTSQVSIEYLMVAGVILVVMIPIFYYSVSESSSQIRMNQAEDAVNSLAKAADSVYALGPGSREYVTITIPSGVTGSYINGSEIALMMQTGGANADILVNAQATMIGNIPLDIGTHQVPVEMLDSGVVRIGSANDTIPPSIIYTYPSGRITFSDITIKANTNEPAICRYSDLDSQYSAMTSLFTGSLMSHESYLGILSEGNHAYYARCIDESGNMMLSSAIINFMINTTAITGNQTGNQSNQSVEQDPPVISLVSPADLYADNDGTVLFQYSVTDASAISFCELIMNSTIVYTATNVAKNITNNITKSGLDYGNYSWSMNCTDQYGNKGASSQRRIFINYTQDHDLPAVYLMAPANDTLRNYWLIKFTYNASDATSAISYCTLYMNGTLDTGGTITWNVIDDVVAENNAESITLPLFRANYTWQVSCTDTSYNQNIGYSETRKLRVNVTAGGESFINSCAGWCGFQGLSNGACENSEQKCSNNCGLTYSSTHNCYAGSNVSSQYCTGGSESDTCCCIL